MSRLNNNQLTKIKGGAFSLKAFSLIVAGFIFVIGVIDGFVRPLKCN